MCLVPTLRKDCLRLPSDDGSDGVRPMRVFLSQDPPLSWSVGGVIELAISFCLVGETSCLESFLREQLSLLGMLKSIPFLAPLNEFSGHFSLVVETETQPGSFRLFCGSNRRTQNHCYSSMLLLHAFPL